MKPIVESLIAQAERECELADAATMDEKPNRAFRHGRAAIRLYRDAARLAPAPERSKLFARAVELADLAEMGGAACKLIREACRGEIDFDAEQVMRDAWDCWGWCDPAAKGSGRTPPFPEPPPARTLLEKRGPIEGQLSFLEGE